MTVEGQDGQAVSSADSILLGKHRVCDLKTDTADFAAVMFYGSDGFYIESMSKNYFSVNEEEFYGRKKLSDGDVLKVDGCTFKMKFEGAVEERAEQLAAAKRKSTLAMTVIGGGKHDTFTLPSGSSLMVGRGSSAGIHIESSSVSRMHARIEVREKFMTITAGKGDNDIKVNNELVESALVHPGDIVELGSCVLLIHYKLKQ